MGKDIMHLGIGCLVAVGSNQEWQCNNSVIVLTEMLHNLKNNKLNVTSISRFYRTPAFPAGSGPDFVNAALVIRTNLSHESLLNTFHKIEAEMGRVRTVRWGQRTIDIDLISYGDQIVPDRDAQSQWMKIPVSEQMVTVPGYPIIPHPRMQDRGFVLGPLMDIAPDWRHPVLGRSVAEMYAALPENAKDEVVPL